MYIIMEGKAYKLNLKEKTLLFGLFCGLGRLVFTKSYSPMSI